MTDDNDLPPALKRNANNVAPFMLKDWGSKVTTDELSTALFMVDMKFSIGWVPPHPALCAPNPEANPPAIDPSWVPPWASKS